MNGCSHTPRDQGGLYPLSGPFRDEALAATLERYTPECQIRVRWNLEIIKYNRRLTVRSISKVCLCWKFSLDTLNHHCQAHGSEDQESSQYDCVDQLRHYKSIDEHKVHTTSLVLNITARDSNASKLTRSVLSRLSRLLPPRWSIACTYNILALIFGGTNSWSRMLSIGSTSTYLKNPVKSLFSFMFMGRETGGLQVDFV